MERRLVAFLRCFAVIFGGTHMAVVVAAVCWLLELDAGCWMLWLGQLAGQQRSARTHYRPFYFHALFMPCSNSIPFVANKKLDEAACLLIMP